MLDRTWGWSSRLTRESRPAGGRRPSRSARPCGSGVERLEDRRVLNASIGSIANVSAPSGLGYQVPIDGSASGAASQTFTVTSSNPDVKASIASGPFITYNLSHTASTTPGDVSFTGAITFQANTSLTPTTSGLFEGFVNSGYYSGKDITRIASNFSGTGGSTDYIIQGGAPNPDGSGSSGLPGTPYGLELNQAISFTGPGAVAVAHSSAPNSNDTQFFITTGPQQELSFQYTDFGQVVSGASTIANLEKVSVQQNPSLGEDSLPVSPVTITSASVSNTNPNGVIDIDATGAYPGETSTVQVTATDPSTKTTATQTFQVTVVADPSNTTASNNGHPSSFTFKPVTLPASASVNTGGSAAVQLSSINTNPNNSAVKTTYQVVTQPAHGTLSAVNATNSTVVYTPDAGYIGADSFTYESVANGGSPSTVAGNAATATILVGPAAPINTGAVRVIGTTLVVTPPAPATLKQNNTIVVSEAVSSSSPASDKLVVTYNGNADVTQPLASSIDRIVVYGTKANDNITVDPAVDATIPVTLDGGHGGHNVLQGGSAQTLEHGWFGRNVLSGGSGTNQLVGRAGRVKFKPTAATTEIFAGVPHPGYSNFTLYHGRTGYTLTPPGGTFYRYVNGRIVKIPTPKSHPTHFTNPTSDATGLSASSNGISAPTVNSGGSTATGSGSTATSGSGSGSTTTTATTTGSGSTATSGSGSGSTTTTTTGSGSTATSGSGSGSTTTTATGSGSTASSSTVTTGSSGAGTSGA